MWQMERLSNCRDLQNSSRGSAFDTDQAADRDAAAGGDVLYWQACVVAECFRGSEAVDHHGDDRFRKLVRGQ